MPRYIPWVDASVKQPTLFNDGAGYLESPKLLIWIKNYGPEFGKLVKGSHTGNLKWVINGYLGKFTVTHWAYIGKPQVKGKPK